MTRDITDRLALFGAEVGVARLALNMNQIDEYRPPPNPAKVTDSRFHSYMIAFGKESWELDALDPPVLAGLVRRTVETLRDEDVWRDTIDRENEGRRLLMLASDRWERVVSALEESE